jgi:hypothetical protein
MGDFPPKRGEPASKLSSSVGFLKDEESMRFLTSVFAHLEPVFLLRVPCMARKFFLS